MAWDSTKNAPSAPQPEPSTQCPVCPLLQIQSRSGNGSDEIFWRVLTCSRPRGGIAPEEGVERSSALWVLALVKRNGAHFRCAPGPQRVARCAEAQAIGVEAGTIADERVEVGRGTCRSANVIDALLSVLELVADLWLEAARKGPSAERQREVRRRRSGASCHFREDIYVAGGACDPHPASRIEILQTVQLFRVTSFVPATQTRILCS